MRLLFSGKADLADTWGALHVGVTPVRRLREMPAPPFVPIAGFPRTDGAWDVYGQRLTETRRGDEPYDRVAVWSLVRAVTRDGVAYDGLETLHEAPPAAWTDHAALARNPETGAFLLLRLKMDRSGFAYTAFESDDGARWRERPEPLFYDGDSMSLFWSPPLRRFVCVNKSLQPFRKRYIDHGGTTPSLKDDSLRDRRVLMLRTSADGRRWSPDVSLEDVWDRHGRKASIPARHLIVPDAQDPPDLEFYSGNAFWHHDRAFMLVLNYAASPLAPRKHAPQLDNEWWVSRDGLRWERPGRGVNALETFPQTPRLETPPLAIGGRLLFSRGNLLLGMPEDRITFVGARTNAEFTTRPFAMPDADLRLNAAVPSPERPFAAEQAYVRAALLDGRGAPIPGFEAEQCVVRGEDRVDIPLRWGGRSARERAGQTVRLRFQLRSANIYAVTTEVKG